MELDLETVEQYKIFECVVGSKAYGLDTPESDTDITGVYFMPSSLPNNNALFNWKLDLPQEVVQDEKCDTKFFRLDKFMNLASNVNPTVIELLFIEDRISKMTPAMELIRANRKAFLSAKARQSFAGYAFDQIKKAKGQNKWVNNPQPEEMPDKMDFCWIFEMVDLEAHTNWDLHGRFDQRYTTPSEKYEDTHGFPFRPKKIKDTDIDLSKWHASSVEHVPNMYRLYHYGDESKGVFRGPGQQLVLESIPKEDEWICFQYAMLFNEPEWKKAVKNWKQYWEWRRNRNDARWSSQESGEMDYNAKNMMHCMRLLWSGINILETGEPAIKFSGESQEMLMDIRKGKYEYEEIMKHAEEQDEILKTITTDLPDEVDYEKIEEIYQRIIKGEV